MTIQASIQALTVLLPAGYLATTILYGMSFAGPKQPHFADKRPVVLGALFVAHAGLFILHGIVSGAFPVVGTWMVLSSVAWVLVALFAIVTYRRPQPAVGAIVLGVAGTFQFGASAFGPVAGQPGIEPATIATFIHVLTAVVASATVVLSGLYGLLYVTLYRQLRRHHFGPIYRQLPDLTILARMTRRAALAGFITLGIGVNVGIGVAHAKGVEGFRYTDPGVLATLAIWLHFGLIAFSGRIRGLTAMRASWAAVGGLALLIGVLLLTLMPSLTFHTMR